MPKQKKDTIEAKGFSIQIYTEDFKNDYISLTDIARYKNTDDPRFVIQNWMRNRNTLEFIGLWEALNNADFNRVQFDTFRNEAGLNRFTMTPQKWIDSTNAIGFISKSGRYGGTYAHYDIAMEFASWISPEFKLYIIQDYKRLKMMKTQNYLFRGTYTERFQKSIIEFIPMRLKLIFWQILLVNNYHISTQVKQIYSM